MERVNLFKAPHKALRRILADFQLQLGQISLANKDELENLIKLGELMFTLLNDHAAKEEKFILKALGDKDEEAIQHDHSSHLYLDEIQKTIQQTFNKISLFSSAEEFYQLYLSFSYFHAQYLQHIYEEEVITHNELLKHLTDEELLNIRLELVKSIHPDMKIMWYKYMIATQNEEENKLLIQALTNMIGKETVTYIIEEARSLISNNQYAQLVYLT